MITSPLLWIAKRWVHKVAISAKSELQKRYLKYLTKKYLKKLDILEYLRIVATDKQTYSIKYIKIGDNEEGKPEGA